MTLFTCLRARAPEAVRRPGSHRGQVTVPVVRGALGHRDAGLVVFVVEQAQLDARGVLGEHGEVGAPSIPRGPEREWPAGPDVDLAHATSAPDIGSSSTAPSVIAGCPCVASS